MQANSTPTTIQKFKIIEAEFKSFRQFIGPSTILDHESIAPGDVLIDLDHNEILYINAKFNHIKWKSVASAMETCHPNISRHYILVPLQNRFSWLSASGYEQWRRQALDLNPSDLPIGYISQIRLALHGYTVPDNKVPMNVDTVRGLSQDAEGVTDNGMSHRKIPMNIVSHRHLSAQSSVLSDVPAEPMDGENDSDEYDTFSLFRLKIGDLESRGKVVSEAQARCKDLYENEEKVDHQNARSSKLFDKSIIKIITLSFTERFLYGRCEPPHSEFPIGTETIYWEDHNVWTYLPFLVCSISICENICFIYNTLYNTLYYQGEADAKWVQHIVDVSEPHAHFVDKYDYTADTSFSMENLVWYIRIACSTGRIAIVNDKSTPTTQSTFDINAISKLYDPNIIVEWQGKKLHLAMYILFDSFFNQDAIIRDQQFHNANAPLSIMQKCGMREFLARSIDERFCGNVLDLPNLQGETPPFIQ